MTQKLIELDTSEFQPAKVGNSLYENRTAVVEQLQKPGMAEVSIIIQVYGHLDKTKRCVESVLEHTSGIDYELILIDNGSTDDTLEYFSAISYGKKTILHVSKNIGGGYPALKLNVADFGRFVCLLPGDLIVTPHWLENLLICIKSDSKIGMVGPACSNVSNFQGIELSYKTYEEMQQKAELFNHSDPRKWEDRLRLITLGTLCRKEALFAIGWPMIDVGFFHDFGDDDVSFKMRRLGYRTVLAKDTWICHDHDVFHGEGKDPAQFRQSLEIGRDNFRTKNYGVDAWTDVNNYLISYLDKLPAPKISGTAHVLGVDVRCGTPILDIKNWLRRFSIFDVELSAFAQDPKYWMDLKTICQGQVFCDREEFLTDSFPREYFDYVVADQPLNRYHEPQKMINDLFSLCKCGGIVICKVRNAYSFLEYAYLLGQWEIHTDVYSLNIPLEAFRSSLDKLGIIKSITGMPYAVTEDQRQAVNNLLPVDLLEKQRAEVLNRMLCQEYLLFVEKK